MKSEGWRPRPDRVRVREFRALARVRGPFTLHAFTSFHQPSHLHARRDRTQALHLAGERPQARAHPAAQIGVARTRCHHQRSTASTTTRPEFALRDQGAALRLRGAQDARWVQTLKTAGRVEAGLHQRDELETPLPAQILNYTVLAQSDAVPVLADPELPLKLRPVFVTEFKRTTRQLEPVAGSKIEFCLDRGAVSAGDAQLPISEIELELKSGPPVAAAGLRARPARAGSAAAGSSQQGGARRSALAEGAAGGASQGQRTAVAAGHERHGSIPHRGVHLHRPSPGQ